MATARRRTQRTSRTTARIAARTQGTGATAALDSEETRTGRMIDWQNEMKYINHDLRELLIITVILFVLLFAIGFFL